MQHVDFLSREISRESNPELGPSNWEQFSETANEFLDQSSDLEEAEENSRWE